MHRVGDDDDYVNVARAALNDIKARAVADAQKSHQGADVRVRVVFVHDHRTRSTGDEDHAKDVGTFLRECVTDNDIALFLNTNIATSQGKAAEPLAQTKLTIENAILGEKREVFQMDDFSIFRRTAGAHSEHPRVDWTALRRVSKRLTRTPKHQTEHFAWSVAEESGGWASSKILSVGGLFDVPWPGLVWNCRKYVERDSASDAENDEEQQPAPKEQPQYVKIGYLNWRDRRRFRGTDCCSLVLKDLMGAVLQVEPATCFVVFDTAASVGEWLAAGIVCSLQHGPSGTSLNPGKFGCYVACVEPQGRQYNILLDRRNAILQQVVAVDNVAVDGNAMVPLRANAALPAAVRFSEACNRACRFLQLNSDFTKLKVSLVQRAQELDVRVDTELESIFGSIRMHLEEPETLDSRAIVPVEAKKPVLPVPPSTTPAPEVKQEREQNMALTNGADNERQTDDSVDGALDALMGGSSDDDEDGATDGGSVSDAAPLLQAAKRGRESGDSQPTPAKRARRTTDHNTPEKAKEPAKPRRNVFKHGDSTIAATAASAAAAADDSDLMIKNKADIEGFYSPRVELAEAADGNLVVRLLSGLPRVKMAGRSDPRLLFYLQGQVAQHGCEILEKSDSFDMKIAAQDLVGYLPGSVIEPPSPHCIKIQKFMDLYAEVTGDGTVEPCKDALLGHSITGTAPKIRVSALRATKHVYKFVPAEAGTGNMIQRALAGLDYTKVCWVLRVDAKKLVPASMGLLNMKARTLDSVKWVPLTKPQGAAGTEDEENSQEPRAASGAEDADDVD